MVPLSIIGCGLIGEKRARALTSAALGNQFKLVSVYDPQADRSQRLASLFGCEADPDLGALLQRKTQAVVIATSNNAIPELAIAALGAGKHVLAEKPAGRTSRELLAMKRAAGNLTLSIGFNHRFHPGLQKAKELLHDPATGALMYIRARYGHGGRLGYEKEWRGKPEISGGGELLDQGVHLLDLCRWFGGPFDLAFGHAQTFFWDWPVEDNGFVFLQSPDKKRAAFLHASCTEWKNLFDFEIFGKTAKIHISGLGRSYGVEKVTWFRMQPEMGPPKVETWEYPGEDFSWEKELAAFGQTLGGTAHPHLATIDDALAAVQIVERTYRASGYEWAGT